MFFKIRFGCDFAVSTDDYKYVKIDDSYAEDEEYLNEISEEYARQNFDSYSYLLGPNADEVDDDYFYHYDWEKVDSIPEGEPFEDLT